MLKHINKILVVVMVVCMMLMALPLTASAANKTTISFSSNSIKVGDSVTVTIRISSDIKIEWSEAMIKYNADILKLTSAPDDDYNGGSGSIKMIPESGKKSFTFKALKAGSCTFEVYDVSITNDGEMHPIRGSSARLNVIDPLTSSNAYLKYLYISAGSLSPKFSKDVTSYNVTIGADVEELLITADTEDNNAKMSVGGSKKMQTGKNTRTVTVTAPNGSSKVYTLNITKLEGSSVSSENTSSGGIKEVDDIVIDGKVYRINNAPADISVPIGFVASTAEYNSNTYNVYKNSTSGLTLFYLFCEENQTGSLFTYEPVSGTFTSLSFISSAAGSYIIKQADDSVEIPAGFSKINRVISGKETEVYVNSNDAEFCLFFAEGPSGVSGLYVYDTVENTVQRYFSGLGVVDSTNNEDTKENIVSMVLNNPTYRMILICALGAILIVLIALIIVLIVKKRAKETEYTEFYEMTPEEIERAIQKFDKEFEEMYK